MEVKLTKHFGGLHWVYTNSKDETLNVICHDGSYGHEAGLFEILPSWINPTKGDSVKGWLNFGEVQKWIDKLKKREGV